MHGKNILSLSTQPSKSTDQKRVHHGLGEYRPRAGLNLSVCVSAVKSHPCRLVLDASSRSRKLSLCGGKQG